MFRLAKCFLHNTILGISAASNFILIIRNTKKHYRLHAGIAKFHQFFFHTIHTIAVLPGHSGDFLFDIISFSHKHRVNKRRFVHSHFSYHFPQHVVTAQTPRPVSQIHLSVPPFDNFIQASTIPSMVASFAFMVFIPNSWAADSVCLPMHTARTRL